MAIDRTKYNLLTDDDGSGLVGSVWSKTNVKDILDAIDAMVTGWTTPTYNGADYTTSSGTWTVDAGDVSVLRYCVVNKMMTIWWVLDTTSVSGGQSQLRFKIPGGFLAAQSVFTGGLVYNDAGSGWMSNGNIFTAAGGNFIAMQPGALGVGAWTASTNTTYVRGTLTFEIQ